ncbi:hypothetical protein [Glaciibacter psychrotolerans]|uniref:Lipoprotein n=2 Tax=Glaciibacter psychrotolerans TaxID=670054 RepID=A0A7Z0EDS3_9MICO|nr:hypothetical protein [Leifsonia psychrotolerans]
MKTPSRLSRIGLAATLALVGVPLLASCSTAGDLVNGAVQDATGGDVSLGGALPAGWPAEVPVIDGEILFGAGGADTHKGWAVTIQASSTDPLGDARVQLEDAGFTVDAAAQAAAGGGVVAVKNSTYIVLVAGTTEGGVLYTVALIPAQ